MDSGEFVFGDAISLIASPKHVRNGKKHCRRVVERREGFGLWSALDWQQDFAEGNYENIDVETRLGIAALVKQKEQSLSQCSIEPFQH